MRHLAFFVLFLGLFVPAFSAQAALYAPGETLDPACPPTDPGCGIQPQVGTGTTGQVPYYAANGTVLSATSSITILSNGNIGIGTSTPYAKLSVAGPVVAQYFHATSSTATSTFAGAISIGGIVLQGSSAANNFVVNADINAVDPGTTRNVIGGGGSNPARNLIGTVSLPFYSDFTPTGWAADSAYVDNSANVAVIAGGYDNVNNQEAGSIVGGGHNFIKYDSNGHSIIGGGSYNLIAAGRSGIFAGRRNTITGTNKVFSFVGGGDNNNINGSYSVISGGRDVDVTGDYSFGFGRRAKVTGTGSVAFSDSTDADFTVSTANQFGARYAGGFQLTGGRLQVSDDLAADGTLAQFYDSTSDMALDIRSNTGGSGLAAKHIDLMGISSASDMAFSPSSDTRRALVIKDGGNVGIASTTPWRKFSVNGTVALNGLTSSATGNAVCITSAKDITDAGGASCVPSSIRFKENVKTLPQDFALDELNKLRVVSFDYKPGFYSPEDSPGSYGLIAEEVEDVDSLLVDYGYNGEPLTLRFDKLLGLGIQAIQELSGKISGFARSFTSENIRATETLCVGNTCLTESQLQEILEDSNQNSAPIVPPQEDPTIEEPPVDEPVIDEEPTPEPEVEEEPMEKPEESPESEPAPTE